MAQDPYRYFRQEARELLDQLAKDVLELERNGGQANVQRLLRLAHTLKGAARVVRQPQIADRAHAIEDALAPFRGGADMVPGAPVKAILGCLDDIAGHLRALGPAAPVAVAENRPPMEEAVRVVRADIGEMDALLQGVAEAHAVLRRLRAAAGAMEHEQHLAELLVAQLAPRGAPAGTGTGAALAIAEELRDCLARRGRNLGVAAEQMERELLDLRDSAEQLRLISAETLLTALDRTARDSAESLSRPVVFTGGGGELRLDAHVLASVQGALVQLVRNAVVHGIEGAEERRAAGKPAAGRVSVTASRRGRRIVFECQDDGRGLDFEAVRRVARQRGLLSAEAAAGGADDLVRLLLRGGISTAGAVTELSGRGIGLDIVRETAERLGGEVDVQTEPGRGTIFRLTVPPSLASTEVLKVEAGSAVVCLPLEAVRRAAHVDAPDIARAMDGASVRHEVQAIPFMPLHAALDGTPEEAERGWTMIVVAGSGRLAAIGVDRLLGISRSVVRPLPALAPASAVVAGAALDADGNPQLVLDPDALVAEAHRGGRAAPAQPPARRPVLVVDDSLTTRMLERSILESAGFEVDEALSGEEGLATARRRRYALFLVDVEMPGMDGFTFIERVRADPALHDIPAILVTSRAAPEDRRRGRAAGAQGHIMKSDFDQARLLAMIRPLVA